MTNNEPGTELAPAILAGQRALSKKDATIADVFAAMSAADVIEAQRAFELTPLIPQRVVATDEQKIALSLFAEVTAVAPWPTSARILEEKEITEFTTLREVLDLVASLVKSTDENMKHAIHNHADKVAEQNGLVDENTPRNAALHYLLEDKESMAVPGLANKFTREIANGSLEFGSPAELDDIMLDLLSAGIIDRPRYLRWTRAVRVVNKDAMFKDMKDPELMRILRNAIKASPQKSSIHLRKNNGPQTG